MHRRLIFLLAAATWCSAQDKLFWKDPGDIEHIDFRHPAGGAKNKPKPPFTFLSERLTGSSPKVLVRDGEGVKWRVKGGLEPKAESFATRFVAALGYYADTTVFVEHGKIEGVHGLKRAAGFIQPDGSFSNGSFERRHGNQKELTQDWAWNRNPFLGTKEFQGLKVLVMLLSNWDNKDARNRWTGSNTGIAQRQHEGRIQLIYRVKDWGQVLGAWGTDQRPKGWDCAAYTAQTKSFLTGREGQYLRFGFTGQHTDDFKNDITVDNVRWLMGYLGRITDTQIQDGLKASGATPEEAACLGPQLRERINLLRHAAEK
ncbi:MAG: hypothetical protein M3O35_05155 [Acidobacteriota bacterium]|nr:hypothetical protein [Acidobacteriota bacterium]